jgi:uncharacterized protein YecE (DUF72 family)
LGSALPLRVHIGCSGWYYWRWKGHFYPAELPTSQWFARYARVFKTVELNGTFYHWPRPATVAGWVRQAPRNFRYAIKVNGAITHERRLRRTRRLIRKFYGIAETLGPKLGCFLFQFPPSFRFTKARLRALVTELDPAFPSAVEFRHASWWCPEVYRALRRAGIIFCSVSAPRLPEALVRTADTVYVRFHGRSRWYRHDYSPAELAAWAEKIRASGAREAWIYFNNDYEGYATSNARRLLREFAARRHPGK